MKITTTFRSIRDIFHSRATFDAEGRHIWGTDRESNHHYGDAYEKIVEDNFADGERPARLNVHLMLEVGVADGSSLIAWAEVFPNATVVGLDRELPSRALWPGIEFHQGDATERRVCEAVVAGRLFDVIVDDASHHPADILLSMMWLWPHVRPGGIYVVEDLTPDLCAKFAGLFPNVEVRDTVGPSGVEPLLVFHKRTLPPPVNGGFLRGVI